MFYIINATTPQPFDSCQLPATVSPFRLQQGGSVSDEYPLIIALFYDFSGVCPADRLWTVHSVNRVNSDDFTSKPVGPDPRLFPPAALHRIRTRLSPTHLSSALPRSVSSPPSLPMLCPLSPAFLAIFS